MPIVVDPGVLLLLASAQAAVPLAGLEWRPLGRSDLSWVEDDRTTGLAVGELDGSVRPALSAFFGAWLSKRTAILGSLGIARLTNTTWTDDGENYQQRHWGVVRPEIDVRFAPWTHTRTASPFVLLGAYGNIPSARDVSNTYSEEEQTIADESAAEDRIRLGGFGARLGIGAEVDVGKGVHIGGQYVAYWQQSLLVSDDASAVSGWLATEASLLLSIEFPKRGEAP